MTGIHSVADGIESFTTLKACPRCEQEKPLEEFARAIDKKSGRSSWCKACVRVRVRTRYANDPEYRDRTLKEASQRYHSNPVARRLKRERKVEKQYGLTPSEFQDMLRRQGYACAICQVDRPGGRGDWHVDHSHVSGRVRGLLCNRCNVSLGVVEGWFFSRLQRVLDYMEVPE